MIKMFEQFKPSTTPEHEDPHGLGTLDYNEILLKADAHLKVNDYDLALIYKIKAALIAPNQTEKYRCSLEIAELYLRMAEIANSDVNTSLDYISKAEEWINASIKRDASNEPSTQATTQNPASPSLNERDMAKEEIQFDTPIPDAEYSVGQLVMYSFLPGPGWHMTEGEKEYDQAVVQSVGHDNEGVIFYKLIIPNIDHEQIVSEKDLIFMQEFVKTLRKPD